MISTWLITVSLLLIQGISSPKYSVSWSWNTLFHYDSRCFMKTLFDIRCFVTMKQTVSSDSAWFNMFHDYDTNCFIMVQHVSRCFITKQQLDSWFFLIGRASSPFHYPDSSSFMLIQPVSPLFRQCERSYFMMSQPVSCLF